MANYVGESTGSDIEIKKEGMMLVAAIDFGTTFSRYAFCNLADYNDEGVKKIAFNQSWIAGSSKLISEKAPTTVLFDPTKKFHSFGFNAENNYAALAADQINIGIHKNWYYFRRFKMMLKNQKIHRGMLIKDETRKPMPAIYVYSAAIQYMKDKLLEQLEASGSMWENRDIHWVLTVPAIWSASAKQFMRQAAKWAGIDGEVLSIALEPEAASMFVVKSQKDVIVKSDGTKHQLSVPGVKYMVIDLGGGTADITVHKRDENDMITEVHKATGGAWGGTKVDEEFFQMIISIVGAPILDRFRNEHMEDYLDLQHELELKKRTIKPDNDDVITVKVPSKLARLYKREYKEPVQVAIDLTSKYRRKVTWDKDKLRMHADIFKNFFKACSSKLVEHLKELMSKDDIKGTKLFLMVGGFSESAMMQDTVKKAFPDVNVMIPADAGLSVLKGAVIFGHAPLIKSRKARYSYGINISPPFDPSVHHESHKVTVAGVDRCRDRFKSYIAAGDQINVNDPRKGLHVTQIPHQRKMILKVFASESREVGYVDDEGVTQLGEVVVNLPDRQDRIKVEVEMMFGKTELQVSARELETDNVYKAYFDFL